MHFTLAIETSNPSNPGSGIAIGPLSPQRSALSTLLPSSEPLNSADRHDDLVAAIDRLCTRLSITPEQIKRVAVSTGPGGYTSLRIAVAVAKMLCESLKAECIPIPTAKAVALRAITARPPFAIILASKDQTAHATMFSSPTQQRAEGRLITAADIPTLQISTLIADHHLPPEIAAAAKQANIPIHPPTFDPAAILELSYNAAPVDPLELSPLYPREPEAVTKWRTRPHK